MTTDRLPPAKVLCVAHTILIDSVFYILVKQCKHDLKEEIVRKFMAKDLTDSDSESEVESNYGSEDESFDNKFAFNYSSNKKIFFSISIKI